MHNKHFKTVLKLPYRKYKSFILEGFLFRFLRNEYKIF